jgi:hypothetical protein
MTQRKRLNIGTMAIIAGWVVTSLTVFWQIAIKDATYSSAIQQLETEVSQVTMRIDETEEFRLVIVDQLSEIKTDLRWIKQRLDELK